jgi:hypothetical protein
MSEIMLIRKFDKPIGVDYFEQAAIALAWCRRLYGVSPRIHFLAEDGLRCACIFDAPDAEAVRNVIRSGDRSEPEALWPCIIHPGPDDDGVSDPLKGGLKRILVLVEHLFERPLHLDELHATRVLPAGLHGVRFVRSYLSGDRLRAICLYTTPGLESVREAHQTCGLKFERMWSARAAYGGATSEKLAEFT